MLKKGLFGSAPVSVAEGFHKAPGGGGGGGEREACGCGCGWVLGRRGNFSRLGI
jgi:hypothetical protein